MPGPAQPCRGTRRTTGARTGQREGGEGSHREHRAPQRRGGVGREGRPGRPVRGRASVRVQSEHINAVT